MSPLGTPDTASLVISLILAILSILLAVLFCWYYGAFRFPVYISIPIVAVCALTSIQLLSVLPVDATNAISQGVAYSSAVIDWCGFVIYWLLVFMVWVAMPLLFAAGLYRRSANPFMSLVRRNYGWFILCFVCWLICVVVVAATHSSFSWRNFIDSAITASHLIGMVYLCAFLGHSLFELPRQAFICANPKRRLKVLLNSLNILAEETSQSTRNGWAVLQACRRLCELTSHTRLNEGVARRAEERAAELDRLTRIHSLPRFFYESSKPTEPYNGLERRDMRHADSASLEEFLYMCDCCVRELESGYRNIGAMVDGIEPTMEMFVHHSKGRSFAKSDKILRYVLAGGITTMSVLICWAQASLIFGASRYGSCYILAYLAVAPWIRQILILLPLVAFIMYVSGWSLTKMKMGRRCYRFAPHGTDEAAFFWWAVHCGRLASALVGNFVVLVNWDSDTSESVTRLWQSIYKGMEKFPGAVASSQFVLIAMFVVMILVAVHVWEMAVEALHCPNLHFDTEDISMREMGQGMEVVRSIKPRLAALIDTEELRSVAQDGPLLSTLATVIY
jgi:hypothetical protein